ncbi:uncharacterized protein TNCV_481001 [Trichonephila clavipes]|nr:uncharacterized protein TNCV_481001 [Trichonephila clavipes]
MGYVKSLVYADKPQTLDHLEDNIHRVIADIRPQMLEKVIESWTSRLDYIQASRGSHMPEIIFKIYTRAFDDEPRNFKLWSSDEDETGASTPSPNYHTTPRVTIEYLVYRGTSEHNVHVRLSLVGRGHLTYISDRVQQLNRTVFDLKPNVVSLADSSQLQLKNNLEQYFHQKLNYGKQLGLYPQLILEGLTDGMPANIKQLMTLNPLTSPTEWFMVATRLMKIKAPKFEQNTFRQDVPIRPRQNTFVP